jgi:hypothetical protein
MDERATLESLAREFRRLVRNLDVEDYYKRFHTTPQHDGSAHIELKDDGFHYVVTERGSEFERIAGLDADDVLYRLLKGVTLHIATRYEIEHRREGVDGRSVWFPRQEALMGTLNPRWGERLRAEHEAILREHPFAHGAARPRDDA